MKINLFLLVLSLTLLNCQPKKSEEQTTSTAAIAADSANSEVVPPDRTVTRLDSVGEAASSPAPNLVSENAGSANNWQITRRQIGPIRIGMPVNEMRKTIPTQLVKEVAITREGRGYHAYEIRHSEKNTQAGLRVEETCEPTCKVWRVLVQDPAYKTKEGLGIGSTLGEVKKHYKITYLGAGETEIVAVSDEAKLTFMLNVSKVPPKQVPHLNLKNTPDNTPIIGMLLL
ncbi:hypothetical protein AHMF7605_02825 [Adhaeribacter arboris]|uniref:Uncharacterized protein n=1 Tax=Adhaeribacter arboris TaxID=2072846 RepID=A0A2T2YAL0_9BACT|nr:hypothetical protein [Adhaeribacter arboris]PSR52533.1 hypothetical protein AHMF7605_02825 [Adhaeribacter arboris]